MIMNLINIGFNTPFTLPTNSAFVSCRISVLIPIYIQGIKNPLKNWNKRMIIQLEDNPIPIIEIALTISPIARSFWGITFFDMVIIRPPPINMAAPFTINSIWRFSLGRPSLSIIMKIPSGCIIPTARPAVAKTEPSIVRALCCQT